MNRDDVLKFLYSRRSVRRYKTLPVAREILLDLARAAMSAPSAVNRKPWAFIIVDEPSVLDQCTRVIRFARHGAPAAVVVCGDLNQALPAAACEYWIQDCSAATENLLLAASGFGLGAVWCGVHPIQANVTGLRKVLGLPDTIVPLSFICIGWPAEVPPPRTQYDEKKIFFNSWDSQKAGRAPRFGLLRLLFSFLK